MEARPRRCIGLTRLLALVIAILGGVIVGGQTVLAASSRTRNFVVTAPTAQLAGEIAEAAENFRRNLAVEWLGHPLQDWAQPCPVVAQVAPTLGAGGRTSFMFNGRQPFNWDMEVQGSRERILDSVLPHEITHTIFATHFGSPLPRWADEGACTTVEHHSERQKHELWLIQFLRSEKGIPFNHMFAMTEYPAEMLPLYSQGYSVARYLIAQGGKPKFVAFVGQGLNTGNWPAAVQTHYGYDSLGDLQLEWVSWVSRGSHEDQLAARGQAPAGVQLASATDAELARDDLAYDVPPTAAAPRGRRPHVDPELAANDEIDQTSDDSFASGSAQSNAAFSDRASPRVAAGRSWYARREPTSGRNSGVDRVAATELARDSRKSSARSFPTTPNECTPDGSGWRSRAVLPNARRIAGDLTDEDGEGVAFDAPIHTNLVNQNRVR